VRKDSKMGVQLIQVSDNSYVIIVEVVVVIIISVIIMTTIMTEMHKSISCVLAHVAGNTEDYFSSIVVIYFSVKVDNNQMFMKLVSPTPNVLSCLSAGCATYLPPPPLGKVFRSYEGIFWSYRV
jgi:hypothetical protein